MDSGHCRSCGRAFTAGEIAGLGILRTRPAHRGGPVVEFACPACRTVIPLVPYGNGRYALPGQPPPPRPTDAERRMPWQTHEDPDLHRAPDAGQVPGTTSAPPPAPPSRPPPRPASENGPATEPAPGSRTVGRPPDSGPARAPERPLTTLEAFTLLGLTPTAQSADVEKAYRERALLCHPDKVAHLDAEFVELANRKFRRLQEARDLLVVVVSARGESAH